MRPKDPTDPHAWLLRAKGNLNLAEKGGRLKGILFEDLCFNAHQAAEKALKAVCLVQGMDIPKTHSLAFNGYFGVRRGRSSEECSRCRYTHAICCAISLSKHHGGD